MADHSSTASPHVLAAWVVSEPRTSSSASWFYQSSSSMSLDTYFSGAPLPWLLKHISNDLHDISTWISDRHLKINTSKIEPLISTTPPKQFFVWSSPFHLPVAQAQMLGLILKSFLSHTHSPPTLDLSTNPTRCTFSHVQICPQSEHFTPSLLPPPPQSKPASSLTCITAKTS